MKITLAGPGARRWAIFAGCGLLAGCAYESSVVRYVPQIVTPYRIDIQQGNFVTQDMVDKLAAGQTREQVRFILGTPLLTDIFHTNRWDYIFRSSKGWNDPEKRRLVVLFDAGGRVERWEADVPPPPAISGTPQPVAPPAAPVEAVRAAPAGGGQEVRGAGNVRTEAPGGTAPAPSPSAAPAPAPSPSPAPELELEPAPSVAPAGAPVEAVPPATSGPAPVESSASAAAPAAIATPVQAQAAPESAQLAAVAPGPVVASRPAAATATTPAEVLAALETWRSAWAGRDVDKYLAMYAPDFRPPDGLSRTRWAAQRRERITRPGSIVIRVIDPQVSMAGEGRASAVFTQVYESDSLKESGRKTLVFVRQGGKWLIRDETFEK